MTKEEWLTSGLGLGRLPWAPVVWAALPPVVVYQVLGYLWPEANPYVMAGFLLAGSFICIKFAPAVILAKGKNDPEIVVVDATAGQALTMFIIAVLSPVEICNSMALGFVLFLVFDFLKPPPCKFLRDTLRSGIGILADDLAAGVYAGVLAIALIRLFPLYFGTCRW